MWWVQSRLLTGKELSKLGEEQQRVALVLARVALFASITNLVCGGISSGHVVVAVVVVVVGVVVVIVVVVVVA